ncbi:hypothetical protein QFC21_003413 [Naganishia friedmannii]|uniref:Uncharacterized protein n=1 Tax=Naganishia friedmannii TaxID=89922 RepID=A0ACC2VQ98_9TREE|nr:hypothetical protein QFC21_003413 [Naganishia friedmannii]
MQITALFTALLATASVAVYGQAVDMAYVTAVINALNAANLTSLAGAAQAVANTTEGAAFLAALPGSNKTLLAPSNQASLCCRSRVRVEQHHFARQHSLVSRPQHLHQPKPDRKRPQSHHRPVIVQQHDVASEQTIRSSSQVVVFNLANNTQTGNQSLAFPYQNNATVYGSAMPVSAANFMIYPINSVLSLPGTLAEVATAALPSLAGLVTQAGLLEPLSQAKGITVFAPNDAAVSAAGALVGTLNETQIQTVLANHVINGTVVYSTLLASANYTSAGGELFTFMTNATGTFVKSGNTTAQILAADIPIANGVVHIIDRVLANPTGNTAAAESAASSYAAQATATTSGATGGGVVGATSAMGSATGTGAGGAAATSAAASSGMLSNSLSSGLVGSAVALFGILAGAALI